jgi:hypothetical protein
MPGGERGKLVLEERPGVDGADVVVGSAPEIERDHAVSFPRIPPARRASRTVGAPPTHQAGGEQGVPHTVGAIPAP